MMKKGVKTTLDHGLYDLMKKEDLRFSEALELGCVVLLNLERKIEYLHGKKQLLKKEIEKIDDEIQKIGEE